MSDGVCLVCWAGLGVGGAAEGDFEAEAFEVGHVVVDLAAEAGPAFVVVRAGVLMSHAGVDRSLCRTFSWVLPTATWASGLPRRRDSRR